MAMSTANYHLEKLKYRYMEKYGERLPKGLSLRSFRHSRATHLATHLTEAELRLHFGWAPGSTMPSIYVHLSQRDLAEKMDEIYGRQKPRQRRDQVLRTVLCRCGYEASAGTRFCPECGAPLSKEAKA